MTDMQLIRYRATGPGRWVREEAIEHPSRAYCSPYGIPSTWQHTHDVRRPWRVYGDILQRATHTQTLLGATPVHAMQEALQHEYDRYEGGGV